MRRLAVTAILLAGCTSGSGELTESASLSSATWVEVDIASGTVIAVPEPDARALALPRWRTSHVLFRRIPAGTWSGDARQLPGGGEAEDALGARSDGLSFLAVFELTHAQWERLHQRTGTDPLPLTGIAAEDLVVALAGVRLDHFRLDLPDADLWAVGCGGGRQALFSWGDGLAEAAAATYAVHFPQSGSAPGGCSAVGSLLPNAFGLFDMHGNAWETVRRGDGFEARGGAWNSPTLQCRVANAVALPADVGMATVGARLALRP